MASKFQRPSRLVTRSFAYDPNDADGLAEAQQKVFEARASVTNADQRLTPIAEAALERAEDVLEGIESGIPLIRFHFHAIGGKTVEKLREGHRPNKDHVKKYKEAGGRGVLNFHPDDFPPLLVSKTCTAIDTPKIDGDGEFVRDDDGAFVYEVTPGLSPDEAQEMWDDPSWSTQDLGDVFAGAMAVDQAGSAVSDMGKGSARTRS